jgi:hypothetical protein
MAQAAFQYPSSGGIPFSTYPFFASVQFLNLAGKTISNIQICEIER